MPTPGGLSFTFAVLALWNGLPADLCVVTPLKVFLKANLRYFCFGQHFNVLSMYFFFISLLYICLI